MLSLFSGNDHLMSACGCVVQRRQLCGASVQNVASITDAHRGGGRRYCRSCRVRRRALLRIVSLALFATGIQTAGAWQRRWGRRRTPSTDTTRWRNTPRTHTTARMYQCACVWPFCVARRASKPAVIEISQLTSDSTRHVRSVRRLGGAKWDSSTKFDRS
jgi:hypothetical protein